MRLKDKAALVTGAASGIGRAVAALFAEEGARVLLADVSAEAGESAARVIRENGGEAKFSRADVSQEAECRLLVA